jgi:ketosteroid isomerase-like protein
MSQGNLELVIAGIEAWNRDDLHGLLAVYDPEVEFHTSGVFPDFDPVYRGHDGITRFWQAMHDPWEQLRLELERIEDFGDQVALEFRFRARGVGSGAEVDLRFCNAITVRDGLQHKIVARRTFEGALEVVRVSTA